MKKITRIISLFLYKLIDKNVQQKYEKSIFLIDHNLSIIAIDQC